jgi:S1-C subfamily serine protease
MVRPYSPLALGLAAQLAAGLFLPARPASAQELRSLFQQVKPSVVVIRTEEDRVNGDVDDSGTSLVLHRPHTDTNTGLDPGNDASETRVSGLGSGVLISSDGKILTAAHVVQTADKVEVEFVDGTRQPAKVLSSVPYADVALIQVARVPAAVHPTPLGDSDQMEVGDRVFAVGAPFELSYTLTAGYVSGRRAPKPIKGPLSSMELLQTDAAVNKGNSGGPLFNTRGEVVGICSYILTQSGGSEGLGFAVTSNYARKVLLEKPNLWTGVDGLYVDGKLAALLNLPQRAGILVQRVAKSSPAGALGLRAGRYPLKFDDQTVLLGGDIILSVNGISVGESDDAPDRINQSLSRATAGEPMRATVLRAGQIVHLQTWLPAPRKS